VAVDSVITKSGFQNLIVFILLNIQQRIRASVNSTEQKRLLMDLDVSMRVTDCPYTVHFYGALFREVSQFPIPL